MLFLISIKVTLGLSFAVLTQIHVKGRHHQFHTECRLRFQGKKSRQFNLLVKSLHYVDFLYPTGDINF